LSATIAHLLRNVGHAKQASVGLSSGGVLNMILDPLFMFVLLPDGYEVLGAALATLLSNIFACAYLLYAFKKAGETAPLSNRFSDARAITRENRKGLFAVSAAELSYILLYAGHGQRKRDDDPCHRPGIGILHTVYVHS
jgi:Na+-driven multidrug efflux pump